MDHYNTIISDMLTNGELVKDIYAHLVELGFTGGYSTLAKYCAKRFGGGNTRTRSPVDCLHHVGRKDVIGVVWSDNLMDTYDKQYIFTIHPELMEIKSMVYDFRKAMFAKDSSLIESWSNNAVKSTITPIVSFANGILRDIEPVLNSIRYTANNAFLEGNVNKLKSIKRTMFGRAGYDLLKAKVLNLRCFY